MLYHGYYADFIPVTNIPREDKSGMILSCRGYEIRIYSDIERKYPVDKFYAAEGFEIISVDINEAKQFTKDVIDVEEKIYFLERGLNTDAENNRHKPLHQA